MSEDTGGHPAHTPTTPQIESTTLALSAYVRTTIPRKVYLTHGQVVVKSSKRARLSIALLAEVKSSERGLLERCRGQSLLDLGVSTGQSRSIAAGVGLAHRVTKGQESRTLESEQLVACLAQVNRTPRAAITLPA